MGPPLGVGNRGGEDRLYDSPDSSWAVCSCGSPVGWDGKGMWLVGRRVTASRGFFSAGRWN
jgi:hypothetical protein